jgi:hypothetical protein
VLLPRLPKSTRQCHANRQAGNRRYHQHKSAAGAPPQRRDKNRILLFVSTRSGSLDHLAVVRLSAY